jgi:hypothetical protein
MSGADRARLAQLLAAVGNHEGKALTFVSMEDDEAYGVSGLHKRFLEIQGDQVAFRGTVNLQQKYVIHSFEPVGLCARTLHDGRFLRHEKTDPDHLATALAGTVMRHSERWEASLLEVFGKTSRKAGSANHAPIRRLDLLRAIVDSRGALSQAELSRRSGVGNAAGPTMALQALAKARMLTYDSVATYEMKTSYRVRAPVVLAPRARSMSRVVAAYLNDRLAHATGPLLVSRDEIEDHLAAYVQWQDLYIRDTLQRLMGRLAALGAVGLVDHFFGQTSHSAVSLTPEQHERAGSLVSDLDRWERGEPRALRRGLADARAISEDPTRVRALLAKAYGKLKVLTSPTSLVEKHTLVLAALDHGPQTSEQLTTRLQPGLNLQAVQQTLNQLAHEELVVAMPQRRSPQRLWRLA